MLAPNTAYYCESGADGEWTKGSNETLRFVYKRTWDDETTFDHFTGLAVDGKAVGEEGYDARRGSVVVDLLSTYLEGLNAGSHTLTTTFDDGEAATVTFTIKEAETSEGGGTTDGGAANTPSTGGGTGVGGSTNRTATPQTGDPASSALLVALIFAMLGAVLCILSRDIAKGDTPA